MKELSVEQKAKAYDEAIKRIKGYVTDEYGCTRLKTSDIFPELAESEDEKMRKWIIAYLENRVMNTSITDEKDNCLDAIRWLEKQDEQKLAELSNTCEFSIKTWINIVAYVLKEHNGIGNYLDDPEVKDTAEKLQKRYKFDSASEEWDRVYRKGLDAGVNKGKAIALREKNHAWNEEDEKMIQDIINDIAIAQEQVYCKSRCEDEINWLKSIKGRCQPQPKKEWSEEDKKRINHIIQFLEDKDRWKDNERAFPIEEDVRWLKSIKYRKLPQTEQEWSEDDEIKLNDVIRLIENSGHVESIRKHYVDWLKSRYPQKQCGYNPYKAVVESIAEMCEKYKLPTSDLSDFLDNVKVKCKEAKEYDAMFPQKQWKPSDEQMKALKEACDKHWESDGLDPLYTLYQHLKKLREE